MAAHAIPVELDDVTPAWLAAVLARDVGDVQVVDLHSGTTGRARIVVTDAGGATEPLFVKLAPFDERQRRFVDAVGLGVAEARFYRDLAPQVPVRVPRVLYASFDDDGHYAMVLEDLVATGCRLPSPHDDDVVEVTNSLVDELALLHASYWEDPSLTGEHAWLGDGARQAFGGGGSYIARALDRFGPEMSPGFRRLAGLYVENTPAIARIYTTGSPTLVHGDPHFGNLFVDSGRTGFFDWAMTMRRAGMWDVAYVLCNSIPTDVRRANEHEWLRRYREGLARGGVHLDAATIWEQYRLFAVYSWSSATSTAGVGSRWQTEEVGRGGMARATAAVDDLDSIALLESLLSG
ncbi:MAG: hypothetical protein QOI55_687 [Actinomycetota bacterium]|nr:hypothetical protein [Actinomycetota bacterium]